MKIKIIAVLGILMILFGIVNTQAKSWNKQDFIIKCIVNGDSNDIYVYLMKDKEKNKQYFIVSRFWRDTGGIAIIERDQNDLQLER